MKMNLKTTAIIAAVAAVLVLAPGMLVGNKGQAKSGMPGAAGAAGGPPAPGGAGAEATQEVRSVKVEQAQRKTLQDYIEVNGDVVAKQQVSVYPDVGGKLVSLRVEVGTAVAKGSLIAEVDPSKPGASYSLSPVYAPISGVVTSIPLSVGSTVSTATAVGVVSVVDTLQVEAKIPERYVGKMRLGLSARLSLEAFPGEYFPASVTRVDPVVDSLTRSKEIVLSFDKTDKRINAGMFARIRLFTDVYRNCVAIPADAVISTDGATCVYVLKDDGTVSLRQVTTGVTVDDMTAIPDGLKEGETVIVEGQHVLSDGAKVRVVGGQGSGS